MFILNPQHRNDFSHPNYCVSDNNLKFFSYIAIVYLTFTFTVLLYGELNISCAAGNAYERTKIKVMCRFFDQDRFAIRSFTVLGLE